MACHGLMCTAVWLHGPPVKIADLRSAEAVSWLAILSSRLRCRDFIDALLAWSVNVTLAGTRVQALHEFVPDPPDLADI